MPYQFERVKNMKIKLLGSSTCQVCQGLEKVLFNVLAELDVDAEVEKIYEVDKIMSYDVYAIPGVVINEKVKVRGRAPNKQELMTWIKEEM